MTKITRYPGNLKAFASEALGTERTIFGDTVQSDDLADNITTDFLRGWGIVGANENPTKQDFNALAFTIGQLLAYLHQMGIAEWDDEQEYPEHGICIASDGHIYRSLSSENIGNDPTADSVNWKYLLSADDVQYDNSASGLIATDVQGAIDEHVMSDNAHAASDLTYDPSSSGLAASNIQEAIDEEDIRIDALEDIVFAEEAATVSWNMETDTWSGDPKATAAHKALRRCIVDNTGAVQYYLDEYDSTLQEDGVTPANLDGTDGQVMVEMLPFYARTKFDGHVATWSVSPEPLPGYTLWPSFADGVTKSHIGAFDAVVYDASAGAYINGLNLDNNTSRVALGEDMLASVATGNFPMVGLTRAEFRTLAENAGFQLFDFWQWQAVLILYITEYGSWNSQAVLGRGNVDRAYVASSSNQANSPHTAPGLSNIIGNGSGGIDDADGDPWVSYRGIENPWGNCWNFVDGWNIQDRQSYVSNDETVYADDTAVGYDAIGGLLPVASEVAIKNWQFVENVFLPRIVGDGASTSAFITDYLWTSTGWRVAYVGGGAYNVLAAGLACCSLDDDSAARYRARGARLSKKLRS